VREYKGSLRRAVASLSRGVAGRGQPDGSLRVTGENGTVGSALDSGCSWMRCPRTTAALICRATRKPRAEPGAIGRNAKTESEPAEVTAGESPGLATG